MRVALSFPGFHRRGGAERVSLEAAKHLAGRGHDVHVFADYVDPGLAGAVTVHHVGAVGRPWFLTAPTFHARCSAVLDPGEFDAVGAFGAPSPVGGVYWAQSVHPAWLRHSRQFRSAWSARRWKQRVNPAHPILVGLERRHFRPGRHARFLALTDAVRSDLETFHGVPPEHVDVLPVGFDPAEFNVANARADRDEARRRLGFTDDERVVLFAANELERKGFAPLLRAVARLDPSVHLMVVGRVSLDGYRSLIHELGMDARVHETGPRADMAAWYGAADVFALPSQYEAWGLVVVEAMACGVPALTTARAGAAVTIDPGRTGTLVEHPDDAREIADGLASLLDGWTAAPHDIADSVAGYGWDRILGAYEETLSRFR